VGKYKWICADVQSSFASFFLTDASCEFKKHDTIIQQALTNLTLYGMTSIGLDCNHNMSSLSRSSHSHRQKAAIHIVLTQINDALVKITKNLYRFNPLTKTLLK